MLKHAQIGWCYFVRAVKAMPMPVLHIFRSGNLAQQMLYREYST